MSIKFLVLGGGGILGLGGGGGGKCRFYFYGRGDFSEMGLPSSFCLQAAFTYQSKKSNINNSRIKNPQGLLGRGSKGLAPIFYVIGFSPLFQVFPRPPTGRPNINKRPGVKFGKISLNYLDVWHFSRP